MSRTSGVIVFGLVIGWVGELRAEPAWEVEAMVAAQPDQEIEVQCNRLVDCLTPVRSSFGGAMRLGYRDHGVWGFGATVGIVHAFDQEEIPVGGYSLLTLRLDFEVEFGRTEEAFGAALRVSPSLAYGWHDRGDGLGFDLPGLTLMLGRTDLWGEVGIPALPIPTDPRLFHVGVGWRHPRVSGVVGLGTFGTPGFKHDEVENAGAWVGAFAHLETPLTERFHLGLRLVVSTPWSVVLGVRAAVD